MEVDAIIGIMHGLGQGGGMKAIMAASKWS
jgi:hypothetical protein